jgi:hypothetical protein
VQLSDCVAVAEARVDFDENGNPLAGGHFVRGIVREQCTTGYKSSLKESPLHTDFIGSCWLALYDV